MASHQEAGVAPVAPQDDSRLVRFEAHTVGKLPAINGKRTDWRDTLERGLTIRVSPDGHRVYALVYRLGGRVRRYTIKPVADIRLSKAREIAVDKKADIAKGIDPMDEKRRTVE